MKRIFSEVEKNRIEKAQKELLKEDLESVIIMLENKKYRSAYIFLFDALERLIDLWLIHVKRLKPNNRKEREELLFKYFSPLLLRKFRSFYYERRGGMYEDFLLITKVDFKALLKFFVKTFEEIEKSVELGKEIKNDIKQLKVRK